MAGRPPAMKPEMTTKHIISSSTMRVSLSVQRKGPERPGLVLGGLSMGRAMAVRAVGRPNFSLRLRPSAWKGGSWSRSRLYARATGDCDNVCQSGSGDNKQRVAIVGAGPAGLLAAQHLGREGYRVDIYDRMRVPGLKFLIAGRGGLNLTHSEDFQNFKERYAGSVDVRPMLTEFGPRDVIAWVEDLGVPTFVGTSRRVFPKAPLMDRASPVLKLWLSRLQEYDVHLHTGCRWLGFESATDGAAENKPPGLRIESRDGAVEVVQAAAVLLALGGASWKRLGSDGRWVEVLERAGVPVEPLKPCNVGFQVAWAPEYAAKFAGTPVKDVRLEFDGMRAAGDLMITSWGVEGGAICALSSKLRQHQEAHNTPVTLHIDLKPSMTAAALEQRLARPGLAKASFSSRMRKGVRLSTVAAGMVRHAAENDTDLLRDPQHVARLIKRLPLRLGVHQGFDDAISSSGGVCKDAFGPNSLMMKALPGVFGAGEMIDWEAPTGGYLLTGTFSTATAASREMSAWLKRHRGCSAAE